MIYLLHFHQPFGHAEHYLGFTTDAAMLPLRLAHHRAGSGSNLCRHAAAAGVTWELARLWPDGDRTEERRLKNRGSSARHCPICSGNHRSAHQEIAAAGRLPVVAQAGRRVHATALDDVELAYTFATPTLCGRSLPMARTLPNPALEIRALLMPGCVRCMKVI